MDPLFIKSGVTLGGSYSGDSPSNPYFQLVDGPHTKSTGEDAMIIIDGATDAQVSAYSVVTLPALIPVASCCEEGSQYQSVPSLHACCRLFECSHTQYLCWRKRLGVNLDVPICPSNNPKHSDDVFQS